MELFSERLKGLRIEKDLSLAQLAKETGLSQSALSYWEIGKRIPNANAVVILAKFFKVTAGYLLGIED